MQIKLDDVIIYACKSIEQKVNTQEEFKNHFSDKDFSTLTFSELIKSDLSLEIISAFVGGAIFNYHQQLRQVMLTQGMEIGELDMASTDLRSSR